MVAEAMLTLNGFVTRPVLKESTLLDRDDEALKSR